MRAYFPLPPNLSITQDKNKILGSITFLNVPNNRLKPIFQKRYKDIIYIGIYSFANQKWRLLKTKICKPYEFIEISRSQLDVKDNEMVVIVPKKVDIFKEYNKKLPEPDSLKIDNSIVAQRASLNFSYLNCSTSYQGEYPFIMSNKNKGNFLSFDTLKQTNYPSTKNFLILMNISKGHNLSNLIKVKCFSPNNKKKFKFIYAKRNSFSIFEKSIFENDLDQSSTIFLTSKNASFIPLMVSIDLNSKQLSVEHTHPPTEYFFGTPKIPFVNLIKNQWL